MEICTCPSPEIVVHKTTATGPNYCDLPRSCAKCGHNWEPKSGSRVPGEIDLRAVRAAIPPRSERRINRNDPCPCGSREKFKRCHGRALYLTRAA